MNQINFAAYLQLIAKYGPAAVAIVERDGPVISAFLKDLQSVQAGQTPSAVVPVQSLAAPKGSFPQT